MSPAGFQRATPASNRPQTLALARSATGIGALINLEPCFSPLLAHGTRKATEVAEEKRASS